MVSPLLSISICVVKYDGIIVRIPWNKASFPRIQGKRESRKCHHPKQGRCIRSWFATFGEHGGQLIFERSYLCAQRTFLYTIYISPKLGTPFSWWGQSKRPHSNLGRCRCVLFGTVSCIVILSARKIAPWSVEFVYQFGKWGWKSHVDTSWPTFKGTQIEYDWW